MHTLIWIAADRTARPAYVEVWLPVTPVEGRLQALLVLTEAPPAARCNAAAACLTGVVLGLLAPPR